MPRERARCPLVGVMIALLSAWVCGAGVWAGQGDSVVLVTLDTARADHFGCYGYERPTTPSLDRFAREGVLFEQAFTHAVNTNPAHATLLTGLYPVDHGTRYNSVLLSESLPTLATVLSDAGYRTAAFVSGHTMHAAQTALNRGFDVYDDGAPSQERPAGETVDRALRWLASVPGRQPYFLLVHLFDPHGQYDPPAEYARRFREGQARDLLPGEVIAPYQRLPLRKARTVTDLREYVARYDGEIAYADEQIGRLLEGVGSRALVVFTADHGETLTDRFFFFDHGGRLNEEQVRVPLILRFPGGSPRHGRVRGAAQHVDLFPTVLAFLAIPVPDGLPGLDLVPFIRKGVLPNGRPILSEARALERRVWDRRYRFGAKEHLLSVRDERYKLIRYPTRPEATFELFDLRKDPGERVNLATTEPRRVERMARALEEYRSRGEPSSPPELDEETREKLRSLGYVD